MRVPKFFCLPVRLFRRIKSAKIGRLVVQADLCDVSTTVHDHSVRKTTGTDSYRTANGTVSHVVGLRSCPKVRRLTTERIVALWTVVKDVRPLWVRPVFAKDFPGDSMSKRYSPLLFAFHFAIEPKNAVSFVLGRPSPEKASSILVPLKILKESLYVTAREPKGGRSNHPAILVQCARGCQCSLI